MGYSKLILRKINPKYVKYETVVQTFFDLVFFLCFILLILKARPEIVYKCDFISVNESNYDIIKNYTGNITIITSNNFTDTKEAEADKVNYLNALEDNIQYAYKEATKVYGKAT